MLDKLKAAAAMLLIFIAIGVMVAAFVWYSILQQANYSPF